MKVLMFSTDASILREGSDARARMLEYGTLFEELHVVVIETRDMGTGTRNGNVFFHSAYSVSRLIGLLSAYKIGKSIIRNCLALRDVPKGQKLEIGNCAVSAQDPFETGFIGYLLKRKFGIPLQLQAHMDFMSPYFRHESLKSKIRAWLGRWLIKRADGIRVVSERIKRSLTWNMNHGTWNKKQTPGNIVVLPIFVDTDKIRNAPVEVDLHKKYPQFSFIALVASRFTQEKNIGLAIDAMREVVKKYPHAGLVIVGDGPEKKNLESRIQNLGIAANVVFEPWTDNLGQYYKTADVFLLTSNYEGYGRTVPEAAAAGLPTITTDVGVAGEFLKDEFNGRVVPVGDARALTAVIARLIGNREELRMLAKNALSAAQKLGSKEEYLEQYKKALAEMRYTK